jgi:hypothetical protein
MHLWWLCSTLRGCSQKGPLPKPNHTHSNFRLLALRLWEFSIAIIVVLCHCVPNNLSHWDAKRIRHLHKATQPFICHISGRVADIFTSDEENKGWTPGSEKTRHNATHVFFPTILPSYFLVVTRNGANRIGNIQLSWDWGSQSMGFLW